MVPERPREGFRVLLGVDGVGDAESPAMALKYVPGHALQPGTTLQRAHLSDALVTSAAFAADIECRKEPNSIVTVYTTVNPAAG